MPGSPEPSDTLLLFTQSQVLCALWKLCLIRTQKVPLLLNLMDDLLAGMWDCPSPRFGSRKCYPSGGHAVIEVFTTRQKCDGTENVGDSDAWLNRLLCTDWRVALWVVMPLFIALKLKASLIRELHYCTACSFWYSGTWNKDHVSKVRAFLTDALVKLKIQCDRTFTKTDGKMVSPTSTWLLVHDKTPPSKHLLFCQPPKACWV